jgi:hypothetical protein
MLRKFMLTMLILIGGGLTTGLARAEEISTASATDSATELPHIVFTKKIPEKIQPGYTFVDSLIGGFYSLDGGGSYLVDMDGNIIKFWPIAGYSKPLPKGHLLAGYFFPDVILPQQYADSLVETDWEGNVVWPPGARLIDGPNGSKQADPNAEVVALSKNAFGQPITAMTHEFQRKHSPVGYFSPKDQKPILGRGKTLILTNQFPPINKTVNISPYPLYNDKIFEVKVDKETKVLWSWDPVDHFEPQRGHPGDLGLGFSPIAMVALQLFRVVPFVAPPSIMNTKTDWLHSNSVSYVGKNKWYGNGKSKHSDPRFHPDNVMWSSREASIIAIIARHDRPGHWKSGDIIWRLGPDFPSNPPPGKIDRLIGAHAPHIIPEGLPGAGNLLVFDNGGAAGYGANAEGMPAIEIYSRPYSRVIEINPITLDIVWLYERPNTTPSPGENFAPFDATFLANAQRLENGNTLISEGFSGRVFEVTPSGELVFEFINPFIGPFGHGIYRAYRVPASWVPENSCDDECFKS